MATFVDTERVYDVIIVGSGVSGLQTAQALMKTHGIPRDQILILEAQDYIGGRMKQNGDFIPNNYIELGAEILHGEDTLLTKFAKENGEEYTPIYCWAHGDGGPMEEPVNGGYGLYYLSDSQRLLRFDDKSPDFVHLNETLWKLSSFKEEDFPAELTLQEYLAQEGCSAEMLSLGNAGYANTLCTQSEELNLRQVVRWGRQWDTEGEVDGDFKLKRTFKCLIDHLKQQAPTVLLNTPVRCIARPVLREGEEVSSEPVLIHTHDNRTFRAHTCVTTASIHVLQTPELLRFDPPLPPLHQRALSPNTVQMQPAMKIFLKFSARCWPLGLQGMIMAPPSSSTLQGEENVFVPETWFTVLKQPKRGLATPSSSSTAHEDAEAATNSAVTTAAEEEEYEEFFYCAGFATSDFARGLDALGDDAAICQAHLQQLTRVLGRTTQAHWLTQEDVDQIRADLEEDSDEDEDEDSDEEEEGEKAQAPKDTFAYLPRAALETNASNLLPLPRPADVFVQGTVQRWTPTTAPYVGGGYASCCARSPDALGPDYARILGGAGIEDKLFFAGEAVNFPAGATAHAALESALRAAQLVAQALARRK